MKPHPLIAASIRYLICWGSIALLSPLAAPVSAANIRLALIPEDPALATAFDVLTVELSKATNVALLERAEIEKVYREQQLSLQTQGDAIKAGQVLGADGVLVLKGLSSEGRSKIVAALVAVRPGVVLQHQTSDWPAPNPPRWAELVTRHMHDLLPKLQVLPKDAIPISILNLRALGGNLRSPHESRRGGESTGRENSVRRQAGRPVGQMGPSAGGRAVRRRS